MPHPHDASHRSSDLFPRMKGLGAADLDAWLADGHTLMQSDVNAMTWGHRAAHESAPDALRPWIDRVVASGNPSLLLLPNVMHQTIGHVAAMGNDQASGEMWVEAVRTHCPNQDPFSMLDKQHDSISSIAAAGHLSGSWVWPMVERHSGRPMHQDPTWPQVGYTVGRITALVLMHKLPNVTTMTRRQIDAWLSHDGELLHVDPDHQHAVLPFIAHATVTNTMGIVQKHFARTILKEPVDEQAVRQAIQADQRARKSAIALIERCDPISLGLWLGALDSAV
jgi:hypothetical protein